MWSDKTITLSDHDFHVLCYVILMYVESQRKLLAKLEKEMKKGKTMPYVHFTHQWAEFLASEDTYLNMAKGILKDIQRQTDYVYIAEEALDKI